MIRPAITPRRITGNATTGLVSAARSGVRNVQRSTNTISKAPDVTKEQRFGMNYVEFFGSKKTYKVLEKSMKTIRDSMVSTFAIAKDLKESVKTGSGVFGFIGKIVTFGAIALPFLPFFGIIKTILGLVALGGIGALLFKFRKQIFEFFEKSEIASRIFEIIKSKAAGFTSYIKKVIADFIIDRRMSKEFQSLRSKSQNRLDLRIEKAGGTQDAVIDETNKEIKDLEEERKNYKRNNSKTTDPNYYENIKALDDRITELKTGKVPIQQPLKTPFKIFGRERNIPGTKFLDVMGKFAEQVTEERASFSSKNYSELSSSEKLKTIQDILKDFDDREELAKAKLIYEREIKEGNLNKNQFEQAQDIIKYLEMVASPLGALDPKKRGEFLKQIESTSPVIPKKNVERKVQDFNDRRKFRRGSNSGGGGNNVSVLHMGGNNDTQTLARNDIGSGDASPSMSIWSNYDPDNFVAAINKSSLNVV